MRRNILFVTTMHLLRKKSQLRCFNCPSVPTVRGLSYNMKMSTWLSGMTPPQNAVSTKHCPVAARSFSRKFPRVVVGGMLFLCTMKLISYVSFMLFITLDSSTLHHTKGTFISLQMRVQLSSILFVIIMRE